MQREWVLDMATVGELFEIVVEYRKDSARQVTGAAVESLRTLCSMLEDWRDWVTETIEDDEPLTDGEVGPGVPRCASEAAALHRKACEDVLWVLNLRSEQRRALRAEGKAKVHTTADYEAIRLRRRVSGQLTPVPERMRRKRVKGLGEQKKRQAGSPHHLRGGQAGSPHHLTEKKRPERYNLARVREWERILSERGRDAVPVGRDEEGHAFLWEYYGGSATLQEEWAKEVMEEWDELARLKGVRPENLWLGFNPE